MVGHEPEIFAIGDEAIRQRERQNECAMTRPFVIVGESSAIVADLNRRFIKLNKLGGSRRPGAIQSARRTRFIGTKNWIEWVLRKDVFDVGDQQLLVLLFVVNSQDEDWFDLAKQFLIGAGD